MSKLTDALDRPSTLKSLVRKTGWSVAHILRELTMLRASGTKVRCVQRAGQPSYYMMQEQQEDQRLLDAQHENS
jgi:biotin operon repressor